jgi:hypothetical protein
MNIKLRRSSLLLKIKPSPPEYLASFLSTWRFSQKAIRLNSSCAGFKIRLIKYYYFGRRYSIFGIVARQRDAHLRNSWLDYRPEKQIISSGPRPDALYNHPTLLLNPLNAKLNPICHLLSSLEAHPIVHVSRIKVNGHMCSFSGVKRPRRKDEHSSHI